MPAERLIVFVKRPRAGEVKTRLASEVGPEEAAVLYRSMAEHVLQATAPSGGGYDRVVEYAPADAGDEVRRWLPAERCVPQVAGELGERMAHALARAFSEGVFRAVLVGTDVPALAREHVAQAFAALREADLVLGPAWDGGYYLVGLGAPRPALFEGIAWSTPTVREQTIGRARELGLRHRLLAELRDVDTLADVRAEWERLAPLLRGREALARKLRPAP
ncbi:MAG TPA: TIGR04282 family arsenosugar biosynthesis glycosyltransferase [Vicinamibacteria bacterium]|nr:TIGR04282 family arsenosugar biosynthesis glycosyltransferase [Vicinamibacteria bacterium]